MTPSDTVSHFLGTGEVDASFSAWEGSLAQRRRRGTEVLADVLRRVVAWRARDAPLRPPPTPDDAEAQVRERVAPMLKGLLPEPMATVALRRLPRRVEVVSVQRFVAGIPRLGLGDLWTLANLLLDDMGAPPLSDEAPQLDGFCVGGRAWLLPRALSLQSECADVVVHECAHLLHELPRRTLGLSPPGAPLLELPAQHQETFAYAVELWSCALRGQDDPSQLPVRVAELRSRYRHSDPRVDPERLERALRVAALDPGRGWAALLQQVRLEPGAAALAHGLAPPA